VGGAIFQAIENSTREQSGAIALGQGKMQYIDGMYSSVFYVRFVPFHPVPLLTLISLKRSILLMSLLPLAVCSLA